MIKRTSLD